jgi:hypothetical protein
MRLGQKKKSKNRISVLRQNFKKKTQAHFNKREKKQSRSNFENFQLKSKHKSNKETMSDQIIDSILEMWEDH